MSTTQAILRDQRAAIQAAAATDPAFAERLTVTFRAELFHGIDNLALDFRRASERADALANAAAYAELTATRSLAQS